MSTVTDVTLVKILLRIHIISRFTLSQEKSKKNGLYFFYILKIEKTEYKKGKWIKPKKRKARILFAEIFFIFFTSKNVS